VKKFALMFLGVVIMLAALWGGSYLMSIYPRDAWQGFPSFMTSMFAFMLGAGCFSFGLTYEEKK